MKNMEIKSVLKKLLVVIILFSMITGIINPMAFVKANDSDISNQYVSFSANWSNGETSFSTLSNMDVYITYDLTLTGGPVFNDVEIFAEDITEDKTLPKAEIECIQIQNTKVSQSKSSVAYTKPVNSGNIVRGSIRLNFNRTSNFAEYDKKIRVTLKGNYDGIEINEIKDLDVHVTPQPIVREFSADAKLDFVGQTGSYEWYQDDRYWGAKDMDFIYKIHYEATNTSYTNMKFYVERTSPDGISKQTLNNEDNLKIIVLNEEYLRRFGFDFNVVRESDGTAYLQITRGEQVASMDQNNSYLLRNIDNDIRILVRYEVVEDVYQEGIGRTKLDLKLVNNIEGFSSVENKDGLTFEKGEYKYTSEKQSFQNLWSARQNEGGSEIRLYNDYDVYITGIDKHEEDYLEEISNGNLTVSYDSTAKGFIELKNEDPSFRLTIENKNRSGNTISEGNSLQATVSYKVGEHDLQTVNLDNDEMTLKRIQIKKFDDKVKKVEFFTFSDRENPFFTATSQEDAYDVPEGTNITEYYAVVTGYNGTHNRYDYLAIWQADWNVNLNALKNKMTDEQINNIKGITRTQESYYKKSSGGWYYSDTEQLATVNIDYNKDHYMSYAKVDVDSSYNGDIKDLGNIIKNNKLTIKFDDNDLSEHKTIRNINPQLYIQMPDEYDYYNCKAELSSNANGSAYVKTCYPTTIDGKKFIVVKINGTVTSTPVLTITHDRKLLTNEVSGYLPIYLHMVTDNEGYSYGRNLNSFEFENSDGDKPEYMMTTSTNFSVSNENSITAKTVIYDQNNKEYAPGSTNGVSNISAKDRPLKFEVGKDVKYKSEIAVNNNETINNIDFIIRLAKQNNTPITNDTFSMDSTFSLTDLDLENLSIMKKETNGRSKINTPIDPSNYTLTFSEDETATYASEFKPLDEVTASEIKTIRVTFNSDVTLSRNQSIKIEYQMKMPDADGKSGATTAVKYTNAQSEQKTLESTPAYVAKKLSNGTINLIKTFQNYAQGTAPDGISLSGIQFKFIDSETNEPLVLDGQTTAEGVFTTNSEGKAQLTNVPDGRYVLEEISTFEDYDSIGFAEAIVELGDSIIDPITVENKLKKGTVVIHKTWEDTNDEQSKDNRTVKFKISNDYYSAEVYLDNETSTATFLGVPYGTYKVEETSGIFGWFSEDTTVAVNAPEVSIDTYENKIARGTIVIEKTMPGNDDVRNVTFKVSSSDAIGYTNKQGQYIDLNTNLTLNIGDYYTNPRDNVTVTLNDSENPTSATITMTNMPLATYTVTEIDIPTIPGTETGKYKDINQKKILSNNGETVLFSVRNSWKVGTLKIIKSAATGVDLSQFKVNVKLIESPYDFTYDETFDIPASGELIIPEMYLGKYLVTEVASNYYDAKYTLARLNEPQEIEVEENQISNAYIYNENTYGYVKILKTLENGTADQAMGIKFKVQGKDATGKNVEEIIEITSVETIDGVEYGVGVSGRIQAGGEYELVEVEDTMPDYYIPMNPISVDVEKKYTEENPLVIEIDNKRARGNLEITTKTIPEGGELVPIRYAVTELKLVDNNKLEEVAGTRVELDAVAGYAELNNLYAGMYKVELLVVPFGYEKDLPQYVLVPDNGIGYAEFEIEKNKELKDTLVKISKEVINSNGNIATSQDYASAQLNEDEVFEAKLTNQVTGEKYYVFFDKENEGVIKGLPAGTYEIEEVFKPKYLNTAYFLKEDDQFNQMTATEGKYIFTINEPVVGETSEVSIKIQNRINADYGLGGQKSKENYSKTTITEVNRVSRTYIIISDEDGGVVAGAQFKLYRENSDGTESEVQLSFNNNTYTVDTDKRLIINGLPVGTYKIKAVSVPEGYTLPVDREFEVYEGASTVTRVEVWKVKPRGSLKLSTVYTNDAGQKEYTPRSKYKIFDPITGKVLKFEKTASGNYIRSKLDTATDTISLRAGEVEVSGIEVGNYELGLVDVTEKYGVIDEEVENITISANQVVEKQVEVKERYGFKKVVRAGYWGLIALTEDGEMYASRMSEAYQESNRYEFFKLEDFYPELSNVKAEDIVSEDSRNVIAIIDKDGKVWTNYYGNETATDNLDEFVCISDIEGNPFNGLEIVKVQVPYGRDYIYAIDSLGKVWSWGKDCFTHDATVKKSPVCISEGTILKDVEIVDISSSNVMTLAIDSNGNVYAWGHRTSKNTGIVDSNLIDSNVYENTDYFAPVCVSTSDGSNLNGVKIKSVSTNMYSTCFIDYNDNLWICGRNNNGILGVSSSDRDLTIENPICLTKENNNALVNTKIKYVDNDSGYSVQIIDSNGKLWAWGYEYYDYAFGYDATDEMDTVNFVAHPVCVTDKEDSNLQNVRLVNISSSLTDRTFAAVDENGDLWFWGYTDSDDQIPAGYVPNNSDLRNHIKPIKINAPQNSYFDLFETKSMSLSERNAFILDKSGKLWTVGDVDKLYLHTNGNKGLTNYSKTEIGAYLEDVTIKDFECGYYNTVIIDVNNKLWTLGEINTEMNTSDPTPIVPVCVSDKSDSALYKKNIVFATVSKEDGRAVAVIDSEGKLYTAGKYSYNLGYAKANEYSDFKCINTVENGLKDVRFVSVSIFDDEIMAAVDTEGNVWTWGTYSSSYAAVYGVDLSDVADEYIDGDRYVLPTKLTFPVLEGNTAPEKIVDVKIYGGGGIALSENGSVYTWGYYIGWYRGQQSLPIKTPVLDGPETLFEGKKIVKIGCSKSPYVMDEYGNVYSVTYSGGNNITASKNILAKDFYAGPNDIVIKDTDNELWIYGTGTALNYKPTTSMGTALEPISSRSLNPFYGANVELIDGNTVAVTNGSETTCYVLNDTGEILAQRTMGNIAEKVVKGSYTVIIDSNGTIYYKRSSGTSLSTRANVQFSKVAYAGDNLVLLTTSDGKLYKLSLNSSAMTFREVTGFDSGTVIKSAWGYKNDTTDLIYAQDTDGTLWVTCQTQSGTGNPTYDWSGVSGISGATKDSIKTPQKVTAYEGSDITQMVIIPARVLAVDSNKNMYMWSSGETPSVKLENVEKLDANLGSSSVYAMLTTDKSLYVMGSWVSGSSVGTTGTFANMTPINLSTVSGLGQVKDFLFNRDALHNSNKNPCLVAITDSNKIYGCIAGQEPEELDITYDNMRQVYGTRIISNNGEIYSFEVMKDVFMGMYNVNVRSESMPSSNSTIEESKGNEYYNLGNGVVKLNDKTYNNIVQIVINEMSTAGLVDGLVVETDGKVYIHKNGTITCLNKNEVFVKPFGKAFELLKDSKYNN